MFRVNLSPLKEEIRRGIHIRFRPRKYRRGKGQGVALEDRYSVAFPEPTETIPLGNVRERFKIKSDRACLNIYFTYKARINI